MANLNKKQFALGFGLGFLLALATAGAAVRFFSRAHRDPARFKARMVEKMRTELRLDAEQTGRVAAILDARFAEMNRAREAVRAEHERIQAAARGEIRELLDETQKTSFEAFTRKLDARRAKRRKRHSK